MIALWAVGAATAFWTIDPALTQAKIGQLAAVFGVGSLLVVLAGRVAPVVDPARLRGAIVLALALCAAGVVAVVGFAESLVALGVPEKYFRGPKHLGNRSSVCAGLLVGLVLIVVSRRARYAVAAFGFALFLWIATPPFALITPLVAFIAAAAAFLVVAAFPKRAAIAVAASAAIIVLATPIAVTAFAAPLYALSETLATSVDGLKSLASVSHRIEIWFASVERAFERPFLGWGLDAARRVPPSETVIGNRVIETISLHSHNAPINLLLELGVFGLALGAATTFAIGRALSLASGGPAVVAALTAIFVAAFVIANVSFGVFQSWWLGSLFLTAAIARVAASQTSAR